MAFFRIKSSKANGSNIKSRGICYATHEQPTIDDEKYASTLSNNGTIYWLKDLTPATKYYVRAYAIAADSSVGYSEQIKMYTLPKSNMSFTIRESDSSADDERIRNAAQKAYDYWSALTSISGFNSSIGYASGTPTADCSYGGWMRVGPNQSYQKCGTIMHEWLHGIGVGTHTIWYGSTELRQGSTSGLWQGNQVNDVLGFWDNTTTPELKGDAMHMWPYGINGAHEDGGTDVLYIGTSLIAQALGEDGLPPTGGFATPCYQFDQEDDTKYYLRNEDEERGLYSSYLYDNGGTLTWKEPAGTTVSDSAAWYITYVPSTGYYRMRNAATGRYISYSSAFKTVERSAASSSENLQLMKGRVDVGDGFRGYYIIHPEAQLTPPTLTALANNKTGANGYDLKVAATTQRWLIMTQEQVAELDSAVAESIASQLSLDLSNIRQLLGTPHSEDEAGADNALTAKLDSIEQAAANATSPAQLAALVEEAKQASTDFLSVATPTSQDNPFDLTYMLDNAGLDAADGWTYADAPAINYSCAEYYEKTFNINQTLTNMPKGTYQVKAQAFQRPGSTDDVYSAYQSGKSSVNAQLYISTKNTKIKNICDDATEKSLGGSTKKIGTLYVPNDMLSASKYFAADLYDNGVFYECPENGRSFKLGLRSTSYDSYYWTIFDNFRLYYYGSMSYDELTAISEVETSTNAAPTDRIFSIDGRLVRSGSTSLDGLPRGIYIVNGKKMLH